MIEGVTGSLLVWGLGSGYTRISGGAGLSPESRCCMDPVRAILDSVWLGPDSAEWVLGCPHFLSWILCHLPDHLDKSRQEGSQ